MFICDIKCLYLPRTSRLCRCTGNVKDGGVTVRPSVSTADVHNGPPAQSCNLRPHSTSLGFYPQEMMKGFLWEVTASLVSWLSIKPRNSNWQILGQNRNVSCAHACPPASSWCMRELHLVSTENEVHLEMRWGALILRPVLRITCGLVVLACLP